MEIKQALTYNEWVMTAKKEEREFVDEVLKVYHFTKKKAISWGKSSIEKFIFNDIGKTKLSLLLSILKIDIPLRHFLNTKYGIFFESSYKILIDEKDFNKISDYDGNDFPDIYYNILKDFDMNNLESIVLKVITSLKEDGDYKSLIDNKKILIDNYGVVLKEYIEAKEKGLITTSTTNTLSLPTSFALQPLDCTDRSSILTYGNDVQQYYVQIADNLFNTKDFSGDINNILLKLAAVIKPNNKILGIISIKDNTSPEELYNKTKQLANLLKDSMDLLLELININDNSINFLKTVYMDAMEECIKLFESKIEIVNLKLSSIDLDEKNKESLLDTKDLLQEVSKTFRFNKIAALANTEAINGTNKNNIKLYRKCVLTAFTLVPNIYFSLVIRKNLKTQKDIIRMQVALSNLFVGLAQDNPKMIKENAKLIEELQPEITITEAINEIYNNEKKT